MKRDVEYVSLMGGEFLFMKGDMDHITQCPKCGAQLQVRLIFASGPRKAEAAPVSDEDSDVGELLQHVDMDSLNDWERNFINQLRERYERYHKNIKMSDKQIEILRKIAGKGF